VAARELTVSLVPTLTVNPNIDARRQSDRLAGDLHGRGLPGIRLDANRVSTLVAASCWFT
jgi:hypothetical protein